MPNDPNGKPTIRFTRHENLAGDTPTATPVRVPLDNWGTKVGNDHIADSLRYALLQHAQRPNYFFDEFANWPTVKRPWYRRVWAWIVDHAPRVHLGPCDHSECGDY